QDQVGGLPDLVDGSHAGSHALVDGVREGAPHAPAGLDDHLVAALHELAGSGRRERDTVLVGLDLLRDADPHWRGGETPPLPRPAGGGASRPPPSLGGEQSPPLRWPCGPTTHPASRRSGAIPSRYSPRVQASRFENDRFLVEQLLRPMVNLYTI